MLTESRKLEGVLIGLGLATACACANVQEVPVLVADSDIAVALPEDWEARCEVAVDSASEPHNRPGWFAVSGVWLKDHLD